jgi:pyrrolidone-carboxylate peptidase
MRVYGFAFTRRNISCQTLYSVEGFTHRTLLWGEVSIDRYVQKLLLDQPEYILGMGIYGGRDREHIRIETTCFNKFRRKEIMPGAPEQFEIPYFVKPTEISIIAKSIGNSWCNLVSWKITEQIMRGDLKSKFTFLHLPKRMDLNLTTTEVNSIFVQLDST